MNLKPEAEEFAPVQFETAGPATAFAIQTRSRHGTGEHAVVLASPAKCAVLIGRPCATDALTVYQSTNQIVVSCGSDRVTDDFFANLCTAVAVDSEDVPIFYDVDPRWPMVSAVAMQISQQHDKRVTPCTLQWLTSAQTEFAAFF